MYNRILCCVVPIPVPLTLEFRRIAIANVSIAKENSRGDSGDPWAVPLLSWNWAEMIEIETVGILYKSKIWLKAKSFQHFKHVFSLNMIKCFHCIHRYYSTWSLLEIKIVNIELAIHTRTELTGKQECTYILKLWQFRGLHLYCWEGLRFVKNGRFWKTHHFLSSSPTLHKAVCVYPELMYSKKSLLCGSGMKAIRGIRQLCLKQCFNILHAPAPIWCVTFPPWRAHHAYYCHLF